jgi:hypothetical protein
LIGDYDGTSAALDVMMTTYPSLLHVFAAANSGQLTCSPYSTGYATIAGDISLQKTCLRLEPYRSRMQMLLFQVAVRWMTED